MTTILLGLGSNIEPEQNLAAAALALREHIPGIVFSSVFRSAAVGMDGDDFLNACALLTDIADVDALQVWLKQLEDVHGRDRSHGSWKSRTLDLDVLMVGGAMRGDDVLRYAHVLVPASELIEALPAVALQPAALSKVDLKL